MRTLPSKAGARYAHISRQVEINPLQFGRVLEQMTKWDPSPWVWKEVRQHPNRSQFAYPIDGYT